MCNSPILARSRPSPIKVAPPSSSQPSSSSLSSSSSSSCPPETMTVPQHHRFEPEVAPPPKGKGGVVKAFPIKLHDMLDAADDGARLADGIDLSCIVSWQPHGRCFVVRDHKRFTNEVMPKYFKQSKFASFQRQLNLYGFQRFTQGRDKNGYWNEYFLRGQRHLTTSMTRMKVKGTRVRKATRPDEQPNFYSMPPIPFFRRIKRARNPPLPVPVPPVTMQQQQLPQHPEQVVSAATSSSASEGEQQRHQAAAAAAVSVTPPLRPLPAPAGLPVPPMLPLGAKAAATAAATAAPVTAPAPARGPAPALITPPVRRMSIGRPSAAPAQSRPPPPPLSVPSPSPAAAPTTAAAPSPRHPAQPVAVAPSPPPAPATTCAVTSSLTASASQVSLGSVDDAASCSSPPRSSSCPLLPEDTSNMAPQTVDFLTGLYEMETAEPWTPPEEPEPEKPSYPEWPRLEAPAPMAVEASVSTEGDVCFFAGMPFHYIEELKEADL